MAIAHLSLAALALNTWGAPQKKKKVRIGACDWSLNRACNPEVFDFAKQLGLDGVQLSYNSRNDPTYLARPEIQQAMLAASRRTGVKIGSIGIAEMNNVPLKSDLRPVEWISKSIEAAKALGVKVVLLAFFSKGDLRGDEAGKKVVIEKLKELTPKAEKEGVILAIESYLSAQEHLDIIEAVGSPALQVYYDPRNAADAGHDPYTEIPMLGKRNLICEIHLKDNDKLLGQGSLDWPRIQKLLREVKFKGWAHIEWSVPKGTKMEDCYPQNVKYARSVFG
ncbi:MAG: sugar phosphate isomerase/epimerase [Spirosomaceae bacterium]|jgi:sugar phosphate isomerase/epimerase|nr:sugar phosphate isomerase/epimerase [Spirosomataceae bacterium]